MNEIDYGEGGYTPKGCCAGASNPSVKKAKLKMCTKEPLRTRAIILYVII